MLVDKNVPRQR